MEIDGRVVNDVALSRQYMVFQFYAFLFAYTVYD